MLSLRPPRQPDPLLHRRDALVNGSSRRNAARRVDRATLRAWNRPPPPTSPPTSRSRPRGTRCSWAAGATGGYVQAYGPTAGGSPVWNVQTNGDVEALAVSSSVLYVGGHHHRRRDQPRPPGRPEHLRRQPPSWAPTANGVFGAFGAAITSLVGFGGEFTTVAGEAHEGVVQFSGTP